VLSVIAGSANVTSFLGLGLFSAHVTGNLVILTAHIVAGKGDDACLILSVPMFILGLGLTRLLVAALESFGIHALRPLLLLQFLMLDIAFIICFPSGRHGNLSPPGIVVAGQMSVAAMAVQNALGQLSFVGAPSTAVMATNLARFIVNGRGVLIGERCHGSSRRAAPGERNLVSNHRLHRWGRIGCGLFCNSRA
jgi:uncharacterized membrane protein YoaK (UPF0700 family)